MLHGRDVRLALLENEVFKGFGQLGTYDNIRSLKRDVYFDGG